MTGGLKARWRTCGNHVHSSQTNIRSLCDAPPIVIPSGRERFEEPFSGVEGPCVRPEHTNARRIHLLRVHDAEPFKTSLVHRHDEQPPQARLGAQKSFREGFTDDYNCTRRVYWESYDDVIGAINREKQLKRWRREKKLWLIERKNPRWQDLAADWYPAETQGPSTAHDLSKGREITLRSG